MFIEGKIKNYNSARGFGFISVDDQSEDIFFHIKDFPSWHIKPNMGEQLKFRIVEEQGKFKASDIVRIDLKPMDDDPLVEQYSFAKQPENLPVQIVPSKKPRSKIKFVLMLGLVLIAILSFMGYQKVQDYRVAKQLKAEQLIQEQKRIVEQQREALGKLPDRILSAQGRKNLDTVGYSVNTQQVSAVPSMSTHGLQAAVIQNSEQVGKYQCDGRTHCSQMRSYDEAVFFLKNCPNTQMDGNNDGEPCERQFRR